MKDRISEFLRKENKSSAQFADEIGVQPSGISHILSGRNKPSLDFIIKMLERYNFLSTEWLLFGKGSMYKDSQIQGFFEEELFTKDKTDTSTESPSRAYLNDSKTSGTAETTLKENRAGTDPNVVRIVWFYDDSSFMEYFPRS
jgi:transcriptional regulator with XRE-family HTH domain